MKRLAFFGGSFNPPHKAHVMILADIVRRFHFDQVVVAPASCPPHKQDEHQASFAHRLAMTELAFLGLPNVQVSDIEARRVGPSYSVETLKHLKRGYPDHALYMITGGDAYAQFCTWHHWQELLDTACLIIARRPGYALRGNQDLEAVAAESRCGMILITVPQVPVSSTEIRQQIADGRLSDAALPETVADYIAKQGLYRLGD